jgi:hypothetical protein
MASDGEAFGQITSFKPLPHLDVGGFKMPAQAARNE